MYNELNKHKSSDKFNWWLTIIAFLLVGATILGMLLSYITPKSTEKEPIKQELDANLDNGGLKVNESVNNGMSLMSVRLMSNEYETYGVTESAESAFVLNATITPEYVENQGVSWEVFWLHSGETFASNNIVTDFVTVTPSEESSHSVRVECLAPFGSKIVVKATSEDNPNVSAHCELDYAQKVLNATLNIGDIPVVFDGVTNVQYELSPTAIGPGGQIASSFELSEVYTIKQNFFESVTFASDSNEDNWFRVDGNYPMGIQLLYRDGVTNWIGKDYYFDYTNDICNWVIFKRSGDIAFEDLTTAQVISYFSNITSPTLAHLTYTIESEYETYTFTSTINCNGYINSTPVKNLQLDKEGYVF